MKQNRINPDFPVRCFPCHYSGLELPLERGSLSKALPIVEQQLERFYNVGDRLIPAQRDEARQKRFRSSGMFY